MSAAAFRFTWPPSLGVIVNAEFLCTMQREAWSVNIHYYTSEYPAAQSSGELVWPSRREQPPTAGFAGVPGRDGFGSTARSAPRNRGIPKHALALFSAVCGEHGGRVFGTGRRSRREASGLGFRDDKAVAARFLPHDRT